MYEVLYQATEFLAALSYSYYIHLSKMSGNQTVFGQLIDLSKQNLILYAWIYNAKYKLICEATPIWTVVSRLEF